jgi:hypothetical protein
MLGGKGKGGRVGRRESPSGTEVSPCLRVANLQKIFFFLNSRIHDNFPHGSHPPSVLSRSSWGVRSGRVPPDTGGGLSSLRQRPLLTFCRAPLVLLLVGACLAESGPSWGNGKLRGAAAAGWRMHRTLEPGPELSARKSPVRRCAGGPHPSGGRQLDLCARRRGASDLGCVPAVCGRRGPRRACARCQLFCKWIRALLQRCRRRRIGPVRSDKLLLDTPPPSRGLGVGAPHRAAPCIPSITEGAMLAGMLAAVRVARVAS